MSYDLYFYSKKSDNVSQNDICKYLNNQIGETESNWVYENSDTGVYFSIEFFEQDDDPMDYSGFENTGFSFSINYCRPDFFGLEAFRLLEKFMDELNLYVQNPQGDNEFPFSPPANFLYEEWSGLNAGISKSRDNPADFHFVPLEQSNKIWDYNFNRETLMDKANDAYFIPRIFFFKTSTNELITVTTWTRHIPTVLPKVDYVLIGKEYKKFFKNVKTRGFIKYESLLQKVGQYFKESEIENCRIISHEHATNIKGVFNKLEYDHPFTGFCVRCGEDSVTNVEME